MRAWEKRERRDGLRRLTDRRLPLHLKWTWSMSPDRVWFWCSCRWVFIYTWHLNINSDTWLCFPLQNTDTVFIPSHPQTIFNPHAAWPHTHDASFIKTYEHVELLIHLRPHWTHLDECAGDHLQRQSALSDQSSVTSYIPGANIMHVRHQQHAGRRERWKTVT